LWRYQGGLTEWSFLKAQLAGGDVKFPGQNLPEGGAAGDIAMPVFVTAKTACP
jgi:hypothetical protein